MRSGSTVVYPLPRQQRSLRADGFCGSAGRHELDAEHRTARRHVLGGDGAAVRLDDLPTDVEAETRTDGASAPAAHELVESAVEVVWRQPWSAVEDRDESA